MGVGRGVWTKRKGLRFHFTVRRTDKGADPGKLYNKRGTGVIRGTRGIGEE